MSNGIEYFKKVAKNNDLEGTLSDLRNYGETDLTCEGLFRLIDTNEKVAKKANELGEEYRIGQQMRDLIRNIETEIAKILGVKEDVLSRDSYLRGLLEQIEDFGSSGGMGYMSPSNIDDAIYEFLELAE